MPKKEIILVDGNSYIHRAFHAIRDLRSSKGQPTNAIFGFLRMLDKVLTEKKPRYGAVIFDTGKPTFRHEKFPEYKIKRLKMPEDLVSQLPYIRKIVQAKGIPIFEMDGYEADDLIAAICDWVRNQNFRVTIISSDKDLMQLVSDDVVMWDTMKDHIFDEKNVREKYSVGPDKLKDLFAIMGDSSDNVPGVPGVGPKGATKLIKEFGSLESVLSNAEKIPNARIRKAIKENADQALLSKDLVRLERNAPLDLNLEALIIREPDYHTLANIYQELGFKRFLEELPVSADVGPKMLHGDYRVVTDEEAFKDVLDAFWQVDAFAVSIEADTTVAMQASVIGISLSCKDHEVFYIPLGHKSSKNRVQLDRETVLLSLKPLFEDETKKKIGHNLKFAMEVLHREGVSLKGIGFDSMIASYLLNPGRNSNNLESLAEEVLDERILSLEDIAGKGKKQIPFDKVPLDDAARYSCERTDVTLRLAGELKNRLEQENLIQLFDNIEIPLITVLESMERHGVMVDREKLKKISFYLDNQLRILEGTIYEISGEEFNIQSPKQLREILFEKLGLPVIKKTKTGPSTDVGVLTVLAREHPLPKAVLEYRSLSKLKSGYVDALPSLIHPETGRIHTSYNQTITATGRLSSSDPNLQNIPIRTEEGREIRSAFVAPQGYLLLSADYSQIELRILAHYSGDESLVNAFEAGEDIHTRTAAEVLGVPLDNVTPDMRRQAKIINFGVIYGMSAFSLAKELEISTSEAKEWIESYFNRYRGVKDFIEKAVLQVKEKGYARTLWGRKRYIPEIKSRNRNVRQFGERLAVNTPIQGTAADIIKSAMIRLHDIFLKESIPATMILQVHDELIFEVKEGSRDLLVDILKKEMVAIKQLRVPLEIDIGWGKNWATAHP